ncbi:MAG: hypothetical protein M0Z53_11245 [Thermaerobacter sp.]|nr:hypothetical protein [Thermaerobacter sp.]
MAISVNAVKQQAESFELDLRIYEGVYENAHYRVRVVDVPVAPTGFSPAERDAAIAQFAVDKVMKHMRRGALPPRGVQLSGEEVWSGLMAQTGSA